MMNLCLQTTLKPSLGQTMPEEGLHSLPLALPPLFVIYSPGESKGSRQQKTPSLSWLVVLMEFFGLQFLVNPDLPADVASAQAVPNGSESEVPILRMVRFFGLSANKILSGMVW